MFGPPGSGSRMLYKLDPDSHWKQCGSTTLLFFGQALIARWSDIYVITHNLFLQGMSYDVRNHQPLGGDKPCRSCTDFKSWMRSGPTAGARKEETSPPSESGSAQPPQHEEKKPVDQAVLDHKAGVCPPDRSGLGSATWTFLHSVAAYFPAKPR